MAHLTYKNSQSNSDYIQFFYLRSQCKLLSRKCHKDYILKTENTILENPKKFWNFVNSRRKNINTLPNSMHFNFEVAENPKNIADLFAKFF